MNWNQKIRLKKKKISLQFKSLPFQGSALSISFKMPSISSQWSFTIYTYLWLLRTPYAAILYANIIKLRCHHCSPNSKAKPQKRQLSVMRDANRNIRGLFVVACWWGLNQDICWKKPILCSVIRRIRSSYWLAGKHSELFTTDYYCDQISFSAILNNHFFDCWLVPSFKASVLGCGIIMPLIHVEICLINPFK